MTCKYAYYNKSETDYPRLYCSIDDGLCIYSKKCLKFEKFIQIDNFQEGECYKFVMKEKENIPKGSYYLQTYRTNKKGSIYLYVLVDDKIERLEIDNIEIKQNYVYLKKTGKGYEVSFTPFQKKTYTPKRK